MTAWPKTTRSKILERAKQGFGNGLNKVPYSQDNFAGNSGYRADCSGYVCRVLGLDSGDAKAHGVDWWGGMNTVTLETSGALIEIHPSKLRAGDIVGNCGPGTAGDNGHVAIFGGWDAAKGGDWYHIYEQCGGVTGPIYRSVNWGYVKSAYVYAGVTNQTEDEDDMPTVKEIFNTDGVIKAPSSWLAANPNNKNTEWTAAGLLRLLYDHAVSQDKAIAELKAEVATLKSPELSDSDVKAITASVVKAVSESVKDLTYTVSPQEG